MKIFIFLLFVLSISKVSSQEVFAFQNQRHQFNKSIIVLNLKNKIKKKSFEKGFLYEAQYLGSFKTRAGKKFYIINSTYVNLKNLRSDNEIFIYNEKKQFVGYYNASGFQLPTKLENDFLFFAENNCKNRINLKNGIPQFLCLLCNNEKDCTEFENGI
ncbi:hypothetical protein LPB90_12385 [Chryseobacterium sp. LC2016-29]|uniref:hypothetical protein n=1 Tax=Chryseobacterium sp. LC2016-29 TaxID=2897331 RepID=UPI001E49F910|nr:hypothetical protein [Chryseobacterium sp. LC2016-29]MCD0479256.1 hypothetical protein [Chryseobacterium sp. LC2016-29]